MNKTLSVLLIFTVLLGCGVAVTNFGGTICSHCGNNILEVTSGQTCDDGNTDDNDGCNSQCVAEVGYNCVLSGSTTTCTLAPTPATCGNSVRNTGQDCDDGDNNSGDGCTSNCLVEPGFSCVDPVSPSSAPDVCIFLNINVCGNGKLEANEACDDGNTSPGDGCGKHCAVETHYACTTLGTASTCVTTSECGNFIRQAGEQCDNGLGVGCLDCTLDPQYYCIQQNFCMESICFKNPVCGDGKKQGNEECDTGLTGLGSAGCVNCKKVSGYTCEQDSDGKSTCTLDPVCGNSLVQTGEQCDNGKMAGCPDCKIAQHYTCMMSPFGGSICFLCGNGKVDPTEVCDNGRKAGCKTCKQVDHGYFCQNTVNKPSQCIKMTCGNGIKEGLEQCDNGGKAGCVNCRVVDPYECTENAAMMSTCRIKTCGNGIREGIEECDNFNYYGCTDCTEDPGYTCTEDSNMRSTCSLNPKCGNGGRQAGQQCDNANMPGCMNCKVDDGYSCTENVLGYSICTRNPFCGDGFKQANQECDNGKMEGCKDCKIAPMYQCNRTMNGGSVCYKSFCGNFITENGEQCDNGNQQGCKNCKKQDGYDCSMGKCVKLPECGDKVRQSKYEECDNGKQTGCSDCKVDAGYTCDEDYKGESYCYKAQCGNRLKEDNQECDNGDRQGCFNCKVDSGFKCETNKAGASECYIKPICGNGMRERDQMCDNGNQTGCVGCTVQFGYQCNENQRGYSICKQTVCGDGIKQEGQECDNGKKPGCLKCRKDDPKYICTEDALMRTTCVLVPVNLCGNNVLDSGEQCDALIGCKNCQIEPGYTCDTTGLICLKIPSKCGNFIREVGEQCDNGNNPGCDNCQTREGWTCVGRILSTSTCYKNVQCGDNYYQPSFGETCEDGNTMNNDGCNAKCRVEDGWQCKLKGFGLTTYCRRVASDSCGNNIYEPLKEQCDDGNNMNGDGCDRYCNREPGFECKVHNGQTACVLVDIPRGCGDSKVESSRDEECDDNNNLSYDGCSRNCKVQWGWECKQTSPNHYSVCHKKCGNGYFEPNFREACDDGNPYNYDGCNGLCEIEEGWQCTVNVPGRKSQCFRKQPPKCGNGNVEEGQECDDGYAHSNDGCSNMCKIEQGWKCAGNPSYCFYPYPDICGNALVEGGQFCDDGNLANGDGCSTNCRIESGYRCYSRIPGTISHCQVIPGPPVPPPTSYCGNKIVEAGEQCDDGNDDMNDGCHRCIIIPIDPVPVPPVCGNLKVETGEQCDDGNDNPNDGCHNCLFRPIDPPAGYCGDGIYQPNLDEQCDNFNQVGCRNCKVDDGYSCINFASAPSECSRDVPPPPPPNVCGNGRFQLSNNQQCDDGNNDNNDGCSRSCQQESGYICNNYVGSSSVCYQAYVCRFTNYAVPLVELSPTAIHSLRNTANLSAAKTIEDIIRMIITYNQTNALLNQNILVELNSLRREINGNQWDLIRYNINACTGHTSL